MQVLPTFSRGQIPTVPAAAPQPSPLSRFKPSPARDRIIDWGPYQGSDGNQLMFSRRPKNIAKEGDDPEYVFEDWVTILSPGDTKNQFESPLDDIRAARYRAAIERWRADLATGQHVHDGVQIDEWPTVDRNRADMLKLKHIHTVEALADVTDANIGALGPGARELRRKAQEFVNKRRVEAPLDAIRQDQTNLAEQVKALTVTMQQLADVVTALAKSAPSKPAKSTEPRKTATAE